MKTSEKASARPSLTMFPTVGARAAQTVPLSRLRVLVETEFPDKRDQPLISFCRYGDTRTGSGALRHDANVLGLSGVLFDFDEESVVGSFHKICDWARNMGLRALVYETSTPGRWRLVAPASGEFTGTAPELRAQLASWLDWIERESTFAPSGESYKLSQSYYVGKSRDIRLVVVNGQNCIDEICDIEPVVKETLPGAVIDPDGDPYLEKFYDLDLILGEPKDNIYPMLCPWHGEHQDRPESGCVYCPGGQPADSREPFTWACSHNHCKGRTFNDVRQWLLEEGHATEPEVQLWDAMNLFEEYPEECSTWNQAEDPYRIDLSAPIVPVEFVMNQYIQRGQVGFMVSPGGAGKTATLLALTRSVALGEEFLGADVDQGSVLFVTGDDLVEDLRSVMSGMVDPDERALVEESVRVVGLADLRADGVPAGLVGMDGKDARELKWAKGLREYAAQMPRLRLVIFDTARQVGLTDSVNEGLAQALMTSCGSFARLPERPSVVLTHHVGKEVARSGMEDMYALLGSSALSDNARFILSLRRLTAEEVELPDVVDAASLSEDLLRLAPMRGSIRVRDAAPIVFYQDSLRRLPVLVDGARKLSKEERTDRSKERKLIDDIQRMEDLWVTQPESFESNRQLVMALFGSRNARGRLDHLLDSGALEVAGYGPNKSTRYRPLSGGVTL